MKHEQNLELTYLRYIVNRYKKTCSISQWSDIPDRINVRRQNSNTSFLCGCIPTMVFSFLVGEKADNFTFEQIFLQKFLYKGHRHQQNHCYITVILEKLIKPCDSFQNAFRCYRLHCLLLSIDKVSKSRVYSKYKLYKSKEPVTIMVTPLMIRIHAKIILKRV